MLFFTKHRLHTAPLFRVLFFLLLSLCLAPLGLHAQVTLRVTAIPANTPSGDTIFVAGSFNNWNPRDPNFALLSAGGGVFSLTFTPSVGQHEYKFTRGTWATVEGNASGSFRPNRTLQYTGAAQTANLTILSWEGATGNPNSTAAANVSILSNAFPIPQLQRFRRIWVYLPPDYATSGKEYPVLYLLDGQNVFDATTSFSGEWKVDETLNALHAQGDYGCIAVAIDNGGSDRLDEYSPWVNSQYGGGDGALFLSFLADSLKPFVDRQYRTKPDAAHTGIMGSSMGGLFAQYALSERQDVFGKAGMLSPAFWFAGNASVQHVLSSGKNADVRAYYLAGGAEPAYVTTDMNAVRGAMQQVGFSPQNELQSKVVANGQHSEWFWAQEFGTAYQWLFHNSATSSTNNSSPSAQSDSFGIEPNPSAGSFRITGGKPAQTTTFQVFATDGQLVASDTLSSLIQPIELRHLPSGVYFLKIQQESAPSQWKKVVLSNE